MTIEQILERVRPFKAMSRVTLYAHLKKAKIRPVSRVRQIPQRYPSDTPKRILTRLGLRNKVTTP